MQACKYYDNIIRWELIIILSHGNLIIAQFALKEVFVKNKGGIGLRRKIIIKSATNLTFIYCIYKEKIAKNNSYRKKINVIPNKSFRYYNQ